MQGAGRISEFEITVLVSVLVKVFLGSGLPRWPQNLCQEAAKGASSEEHQTPDLVSAYMLASWISARTAA